MSAMASQITGTSIIYSTFCSGAGRTNPQYAVSLPFMREICRWLVDSPQKGPATRKMFLFGDVIMVLLLALYDH